MNYSEEGKRAENLKIAYIGGGSRNWARGLMSDLACEASMSGEVFLYDIDGKAARDNAIIGNKISALPEAVSKWKYKAVDSLKTALTGADFVVISIQPATLDEMKSDVHAPEKYGIYQSVGDSVGPGGIVRALRTVPMYVEFAEAIKRYCPEAWVINYTNPMTMCVATLYKVFPRIKAFGCCHEVFSTQTLIAAAYEEKTGRKITRYDVNVNVVGINHFTWITSANYGKEDLFGIYADFADKYAESGYDPANEKNWLKNGFACAHRVKFDLFRRYGAIAAAGDRHLAEFCPGKWYLESPEQVREWCFALTDVDSRIAARDASIVNTEKMVAGEKPVVISKTGEEGTKQMKAILGLEPRITNVNMPNVGQISDFPKGFVVETNAAFTARGVQPIAAGSLPKGVDNLVQRVAYNQELTVEAGISGNYELAFRAFVNDPLVTISTTDARKLFDEMLKNTAEYLPDYDKYLKR